MLWTICVILLVLWALGLATSYTAGGLIHILLVVALVVLVIRLVQGRRVILLTGLIVYAPHRRLGSGLLLEVAGE